MVAYATIITCKIRKKEGRKKILFNFLKLVYFGFTFNIFDPDFLNNVLSNSNK